jgi:hypothetical protein
MEVGKLRCAGEPNFPPSQELILMVQRDKKFKVGLRAGISDENIRENVCHAVCLCVCISAKCVRARARTDQLDPQV